MNAYREPADRPRRPSQYQQPIEEERTVVNAGRLWAGGMAAAVVSGLVALVGLLVVRVVFKLPVLGTTKNAFGDSRTVTLVVLAIAAALVATGLAHLLLISTPSPQSYFGWIVGLLTVAAVVSPFLGSQKLAVQVAQAVIYLVIGIAIGGLVSQAAAAASRTELTRR